MEPIQTEKIITFTEKWASANGMDVADVKEVVSNMEMSDYMVFVEAAQSKNYDEMAQLYYRAKASMTESYEYFIGDRLIESVGTVSKDMMRMTIIKDIPSETLYEYYRKLPGATHAIDSLSYAHIRAMMCEGFGQMQSARTMKPTANPASQMNGPSTTTATANPAMQLKQKQQQLQQPSANMQVSVPQGTIGGELTDLEGVDIDPQNPENTQVVVKSPNNPNEIDVLSLDDIDLVQETDRISKLAGIK